MSEISILDFSPTAGVDLLQILAEVAIILKKVRIALELKLVPMWIVDKQAVEDFRRRDLAVAFAQVVGILH